jgi:hypothetical protein
LWLVQTRENVLIECLYLIHRAGFARESVFL